MDPGLWRDRIILDEFIVIVHSIEWDVSLLTLYGGEFTFSTQLLTLNHLLTFPPTQHHSFFRNLPHLFIYHEASLRIGSEKPGFQAEWWSFANSILSVRPHISKMWEQEWPVNERKVSASIPGQVTVSCSGTKTPYSYSASLRDKITTWYNRGK